MRVLLCLLMMLPAQLFAAEAVADDPNVAPKVAEQIRKQLSDLKIDSVRLTPISGLYEVQSGGNLYYVERTGKHLIANGHIFDTATRQDLTAVRLQQINSIDWSVLPLDKAIVSGDPQGIEMAVFTDPDCPYCTQLEVDIKTLTGVKVYTFLMPLVQLHPDAARKSEAIWCAKDQHAALIQVMVEKKAISGGGCKTPLQDIAILAESLNIHGTPTIIARDGRKMSGGLTAEKLKAWLTQK